MESGKELFHKVIALTGLPQEQIAPELDRILQSIGASADTVSVEDLQKALYCYLMEVIGSNITAPEPVASLS